MQSYFVTSPFRLQKTKFLNHAQVLKVLQVCVCVILWGCVFRVCDCLVKTVLLAKWAVCGELWWPEVRTESHCICSWMSVMLRATVAGRSAWEPPEGGMLSCFNLCQCPSVLRWWEFRARCVSLQLAIDPADRSCRQPSKASAFLFVYVRPYQCYVHPLLPYQCGPPRGQIGRAAPFVLSFPCKHGVQLSFCQCLCGVSLGVARRTCFASFALPLSFKHVTRAEPLRFDSCPGPRLL